MRFLKWVCAVGVAATTFAPVVGFAQDASQCACLVPFQPGILQVGQVQSFRGDVQVTQPAGYNGPQTEGALSVGSRILIGPGASADISVVPSCNLSVAENSTVNISRIGEQICVSIEEVGRAAGYFNGSGLGFPEYFFGASVGTAALAGALGGDGNDDDGEPASR